MTMHWIQRDKHHLESDCGRYTVSRATVWGTWRYCAWRREPPRQPEHLGTFDDPEEAKACAAADGDLRTAVA